jgi:hypothetical protein
MLADKLAVYISLGMSRNAQQRTYHQDTQNPKKASAL